MTTFSPSSWRERYPGNPQDALLALATYWSGNTEEVRATLWETWYRTDASTDGFVSDSLAHMFEHDHLGYGPILCTGIPYWPAHRFNDPAVVRLLATQADELRSSLWMDFGTQNPQGVKNLFATFHRVRKSLRCMEQHWLDEYPSSTPIVAPLSDTVLQDIYPANRFRMRNRLISRTDLPVWSCYLKNHPTDRLAFLLDIFLCRSSADALDWAKEQTSKDESYTMAAFCLHNDLAVPSALSMDLPPHWQSRLDAVNCVLKPNIDFEVFILALQEISHPLESSTPIPPMLENDYFG